MGGSHIEVCGELSLMGATPCWKSTSSPSEEEGAAETPCAKLTAIPFFIPCTTDREKGENSGVKFRLERRESGGKVF